MNPPHWYGSPEWILVIVGAVTAIVIGWQSWETEKAAKAAADSVNAIRGQTAHIARQAKSMRRQTTILRNNVNALIASERAWVEGVLQRPSGTAGNRYKLVIRNHGKTPAHVHSYEVGSGLFQENVSTEALSKTVFPANFLLGADAERSLGDPIDMDRLFPAADGTKTGAFCVTVVYSDLVSGNDSSGNRHRTFFMYYYRPLLTALDRIPVDEYT